MSSEKFDLNELCSRAALSSKNPKRTVSYYIKQGLLPSPEKHGPHQKYDLSQLNRLRLIKRLQREHLSLAEIRSKLEALSDDQVEEALRVEAPKAPAPESALSYVQQVLSRENACHNESEQADMLQRLRNAAETMKQPVGWNRSEWERIVLTRDIELHVRRPLTKEDNKRLERLIDKAGKILKED